MSPLEVLNYILSENTSGVAVGGDVLREVQTSSCVLEASSRSERRIRQVKMACNARSTLEEIAGLAWNI
jgi:hypothetical protein